MFICPKCKKAFKSNQSLLYHLDKAKVKCDSNKEKSNNIDIIQGKKLYCCDQCDNKYTRLGYLKTHKTNIHNINTVKEIKEDKLDIQGILNAIYAKMTSMELQIQNNTTIQNGIQNILGDNNVINNNTLNVMLNNYDKENIEYIDENTWIECTKSPITGIPILVGLTNYDEKHPENHNVILKNKQTGEYSVFVGNKWEVKDEKDVLINFIENGAYRIENFYEKNKDHEDLQGLSQEDLSNTLDDIEKGASKNISKYKPLKENLKNIIFEGLLKITNHNKNNPVKYLNTNSDLDSNSKNN
jgi:hypothetical protein